MMENLLVTLAHSPWTYVVLPLISVAAFVTAYRTASRIEDDLSTAEKLDAGEPV